MPSSINNYRKLIEEPWGKMFYDMIYKQLSLPENIRLNILDFGAGFCVASDYYAKNHIVTAVEPDIKMHKLRLNRHEYKLLTGSIEALGNISDCTFDIVLCHNVLEYVDDKEAVLTELVRLLKPKGRLSIVKHNLKGRILSDAVMKDNPQSALNYLNNDSDNSENMFGRRDTYTNDYLIKTLKPLNLICKNIYGIRTFFALSSNNDIKYSSDWYSNMLELEMKACNIDEFKNIAFFNHLIFEKESA